MEDAGAEQAATSQTEAMVTTCIGFHAGIARRLRFLLLCNLCSQQCLGSRPCVSSSASRAAGEPAAMPWLPPYYGVAGDFFRVHQWRSDLHSGDIFELVSVSTWGHGENETEAAQLTLYIWLRGTPMVFTVHVDGWYSFAEVSGTGN